MNETPGPIKSVGPFQVVPIDKFSLRHSTCRISSYIKLYYELFTYVLKRFFFSFFFQEGEIVEILKHSFA